MQSDLADDETSTMEGTMREGYLQTFLQTPELGDGNATNPCMKPDADMSLK